MLSFLEFFITQLGCQFVATAAPIDGVKQTRIVSSLFKTLSPLTSNDLEYKFGRDITFDIMALIRNYVGQSYSSVKTEASFDCARDEINCRDFFETGDFNYLMTLSAIVENLYDSTRYATLEHDNCANLNPKFRIPAALLDITAKKPMEPHRNPRHCREMTRDEERTDLLLKSIKRLAVYRDSSESPHIGVLLLMQKFLVNFVVDEKARLRKALELTNREKKILETEALGDVETADQRSLRLFLIRTRARLEKAASNDFYECLKTMLTRLLGLYCEFTSNCGGISVERRKQILLNYPDICCDEFLQIRRSQFAAIVGQSGFLKKEDFVFYSRDAVYFESATVRIHF